MARKPGVSKLGLTVLGAIAGVLGIASDAEAAAPHVYSYIDSPAQGAVYRLGGNPTVTVAGQSTHVHQLRDYPANTDWTAEVKGYLTMPQDSLGYHGFVGVTVDNMGHWEDSKTVSNSDNLGVGNYTATTGGETRVWQQGLLVAEDKPPAHSHDFMVVAC